MIRRLFEWLFMPNDWIQVWGIVGKWYIDDPKNISDRSSYVIWFSKSRNRYKLSLSGYKPKYHTIYADVISTFNAFNYNLNIVPKPPTKS